MADLTKTPSRRLAPKRKLASLNDPPARESSKRRVAPRASPPADDACSGPVEASSRKLDNTSESQSHINVNGHAHDEKRLKRFRAKAPLSYCDCHARAMTQRMFVLGRERANSGDCPYDKEVCPMESVDIAGTTGNIYTVQIGHIPTCTCPSFGKGTSPCKHIIYVLVKVLKVPEYLRYQTSLLTTELVDIFDKAGPLPADKVDENDKDGKRKPIEGDCPICCCDMEPEAEKIVWCKAACGNNLHKTCFDQWAASKRGGRVPCPYCRTPWETHDPQSMKGLKDQGKVGRDGYVNIASGLGLSGLRDYSSYHSFWVRRERRAGRIADDAYEGYG